MRFQNLETGRVVQAVMMAFGMAVLLSFLTSCLLMPLLPNELLDRFTNILNLAGKPETSSDQLQRELTNLTHDYGSQLNALYIAQWSFAAIATFWMGRWAARRASTPDQASSYGLAVGLGTAFTYGVLCVMCSVAMLLIRLGFFVLLIAAGALGGRTARQNAGKFPAPYPTPEPGPDTFNAPTFPLAGRPSAPAPRGTSPEIYYNMGVSAALGGRRDEARQHFTHVLQMNPRHVAAWLQLANLADTPEQAWNYVQQARAINPNDPAVQQAVSVIWPKVEANAQAALSTPPPPAEVPPPPAITPPAAEEPRPPDADAPDNPPPAP